MDGRVLTVDFYGDMQIQMDGKELREVLSKKSVALISYLMAAPARQVSKNALKDLFWIDAGEKAAYNLRFNLWNIKKNIPEIDGENFILTAGGVCSINPAYPVKKTGLEKLENISDFDEEELEEIIGKGAGLEFMEHFYLKGCDEFNDWLTLERSNRERRIINAGKKAADCFEKKGEHKRALDLLKNVAFLSPYEDDIHTRIMNIHRAMGNFGEAAGEYRNYCQKLKKDLSVTPSREVKEVYSDILAASRLNGAETVRIRNLDYNSEYAAAAEMLRGLFPEFECGMTVEIDNWDNLDQKSKEFFEAMVREKIIIIGR